MIKCPVCEKHEFERSGDYQICPVCGWENDPLQREEPDFEGGANQMSLNQAKEMYHNQVKGQCLNQEEIK